MKCVPQELMQLRLTEPGASETESSDGTSRGLAAGCCFDFNQVYKP